jgi:Tfp pilus assembly protein PilN
MAKSKAGAIRKLETKAAKIEKAAKEAQDLKAAKKKVEMAQKKLATARK